ncbi:AMP-binding protein [Enterobacter asburiae]|uniref:AMP-binding protein n=1 Tax=Enterobacter asburiae TaxID=61645 RepID=UPI0011D1E9D4|nr:AMP-binding protein [Enterobacter asburiae]
MDFYSLLNGAWRIRSAKEELTAGDVREKVDYFSSNLVADAINKNVDFGEIFVFVIRNNIEGMLSYFIASRLKVHAMLLNIKDINNLPCVINVQHVAAVIHFSADVSASTEQLIHIRLNEVISKSPQPDTVSVPVSREGLAEAFFYFTTSGTTSVPKLVRYHESSLVGNAECVSQYLGLTPEDNTICFFPVQYMYGLSTMLTVFISKGVLVFEHFQLGLVPELIEKYSITTMPLIGDLMIPLSKVLQGKSCRIKRILNASDRLLASQAISILPYCETLWNNFGQTESGPRLFCVKITSSKDIRTYSRYGVIPPGFPMIPEIKTEIRSTEAESEYGELYYHTPFAADGYVSKDFVLTPQSYWQKSGDLFAIDHQDCHHWYSRVVNEFKVKGKFVPIQIISDQIMSLAGTRHYFNRDKSGVINLNIESSVKNEELNKIKLLLSNNWHQYSFNVNVIPQFDLTPSGKIKTVQ